MPSHPSAWPSTSPLAFEWVPAVRCGACQPHSYARCRCSFWRQHRCANAAPALARQTPGLKVSDNKRFLVTADGRPFFWLGDTAWELFHRPTREDVSRYLRKRAEQRFTVIQAVALAEFDGLERAECLRPSAARQQRPDDPRRQGRRRTTTTGITSTSSSSRRDRSGSTSRSCRRGVTSGRSIAASGRRSSRRRTPKRTARGSASATRTRRTSSGSSAATARSTPTRTSRSSGRWRAGSAPATAART